MHIQVTVRPSVAADIPAIGEIYAYYVQSGVASFEIAPPDADEITRRWSTVAQSGLPWLAAETEVGVVGYAYATFYRSRPAYRFTVEDSIYVHPEHTGKGIGQALMPKLIALCEESGARQMVAIIGGIDNTASIRLHEKFGFKHVGVLEAVGYKFDRWVDTVLMQRALATGSQTRPR